MSSFCREIKGLRHTTGLGVVLVLGLVGTTPGTARAQAGLGLALPGLVPPAKVFDHSLDAQLVKAVIAGRLDEVQSLLKRGADPNTKDTDQYVTPVLQYAAGQYSNTDILSALIAAGANVEATNAQGATALQMASVDSHVATVKILLQAKAKVDARTSLGLTALMLAASAGEMDTVRVLLDAGADVNALSNDKGTPLVYGSAKTIAGTGNLDIIKLLVQHGADVGVQTTSGKTAAMTATEYGLDDIATYLHSIEDRDRALFNALAHAYNDRKNPQSTMWNEVKATLEAGANPRFTTSDGRTGLMFLAYGLPGADNATVQKIVDHSDLSAQEQQFGATALHLAVDNQNSDLVTRLLLAGAPRNIKTKKGQTPLEMAQEIGNQGIIILFSLYKETPKQENLDGGEIIFYVQMPEVSVPERRLRPCL